MSRHLPTFAKLLLGAWFIGAIWAAVFEKQLAFNWLAGTGFVIVFFAWLFSFLLRLHNPRL